jgi:hypothetical protein
VPIFDSHILYLLCPAEELLIDFCELIGEHSGENMAEAVWRTMELYGLVGRVCNPSTPFEHFANAFTDYRYRNGQRQQQQHDDGITSVPMPGAWHLVFSARRSHAMHAPYDSFSGN